MDQSVDETQATEKNDSLPEELQRRVFVLAVHPEVDCGAYPVKRILGDEVVVTADLVADGHDEIAGALRYRHATEAAFTETPLEPLGNDRWQARFVADRLGYWRYTVEGWIDAFATWRRTLRIKHEVGQDTSVELLIGAQLVARAAERASGDDAHVLAARASSLADPGLPIDARVETALGLTLLELMRRHADRTRATRHRHLLELVVDPPRAGFSAWYEMFPRSCGEGTRHGRFRDCEHRLRYIADLGFDVVYLPPIHPIGGSFRKGPDNSLQSGPDDPGSPWAIGAPEGGHKAVHPELGTLEDFRWFVQAARSHGLEVALDVAFQASPDHPYVKDHPEWFRRRPDGTIQYAENPPKKYQDIYPFDFDSHDWRSLYEELCSVFRFWLDQGIRIFRVDNPHTKPLPFWLWCLRTLKAQYPDAIFLSEAFTRPRLMYALAKVGFTQSYTYFTWRNTRQELVDYLTELTRTEVADYFRPNFWPNTPDILPEHLQHGGRGAFVTRLVLAATLSSNYGIYGPAFELMDHVARPGSEEYAANEKYEIKDWDVDRADSLRHVIKRINRIRRENPALQENSSLVFHGADNGQILCYSKCSRDRGNTILVVTNLDHHGRQSGWVHLDTNALGLDESASYEVHDLLSGARYRWQGVHNYVELDPHGVTAHVFRVNPA